MYTFKDSGKTVGDLKDGDVVVLLKNGVPTVSTVSLEMADWDFDAPPYLEFVFEEKVTVEYFYSDPDDDENEIRGSKTETTWLMGLKNSNYPLKELEGVLYFDISLVSEDEYNCIEM